MGSCVDPENPTPGFWSLLRPSFTKSWNCPWLNGKWHVWSFETPPQAKCNSRCCSTDTCDVNESA
ncbi:Gag-Pol polyprotein [Clarias magur]|uniref:Gag-Pol polyprotein n=1 Tax=Clarias magur TaxID=1594786 RepID=A0A8J4U2J0_CLAMG|nr:Gag-Pol polyprotein [Clarias magur]